MSLLRHLEKALLEKFIHLIAANTGLSVREQDRNGLARKILFRIKSLKLFSPESYYQLLASESNQSRQEWQELIVLLTTTESYFFRDRGQLNLLQKIILPELIQRQKATKTLKIWSAGCSTGEEPFSLAIILQEILPDLADWQISIWGTDINREALAKAEKGVYTSWSFRLVERKILQNYFHPISQGFQLKDEIRELVKFENLNLVTARFDSPNYNIYDLDLVLCRNVFIYFDKEAIATVLAKFHQTIKPGGYLLTGHAELYGQNLQNFQTKIYPESIVYQRSKQRSLLKSPSDRPVRERAKIIEKPPIRQSITPAPTTAKNLYSEAQTRFQQKAYTSAIAKAKQVLQLEPRNFRAYFLLAQIYANLGKYEQAIHYCHQAISIDSFAIETYQLLAKIAEEQGDIQTAKNLLKKIIYLDYRCISAYLELSHLYAREGDSKRAEKMEVAGKELLRELTNDSSFAEPG
ncbi:CheR family methyltransferase [Oscillatoria salina]|uniref:CheR family methyltransferase n=1 Tax=Oscillatoria salina TaxID=331517 RepID=UPI0013BAFE7B|nr:protein-glutamate O-methyltransferase CheR [Oscillatoria salina]MBZ8178745.1 tetratricopeptide repeat protein [Oscillatoria salina IIICB1]NET91016.1 tetratricopeptide repeat protein [Kamptonema sp. SIO1D9]